MAASATEYKPNLAGGSSYIRPFPLLGFDTDNSSVFMNETVRDYCKEAGIEFTRC